MKSEILQFMEEQAQKVANKIQQMKKFQEDIMCTSQLTKIIEEQKKDKLEMIEQQKAMQAN